MCGLVTITLVFTVRSHVRFTFVSLSKTYSTLKKQAINIQPRYLIYVKRPYRSFIYLHLVRQWCATGRHPGLGLGPCPGWPTRFLCLTPNNAASAAAVNPAGCHPVQLATQAGSTRRPALLISFSIFILICTRSMYKVCTQGKKSAKTAFTS